MFYTTSSFPTSNKNVQGITTHSTRVQTEMPVFQVVQQIETMFPAQTKKKILVHEKLAAR